MKEVEEEREKEKEEAQGQGTALGTQGKRREEPREGQHHKNKKMRDLRDVAQWICTRRVSASHVRLSAY